MKRRNYRARSDDMSDPISFKLCDRCGMEEHGSASCESVRQQMEAEIDEFIFAQHLVDEAEYYPSIDEPDLCAHCKSYGQTEDGHSYICPHCGDEWDVWEEFEDAP